MVYTVTFNPALDYVMKLKRLSPDDINRAESEELYYGGKGINVSAILSRLGIPNVALGFAAGFTGEKLRELMDSDGINNDFLELDSGFTRINVKLKCGEELDINASGPKIPSAKIDELFAKLERLERGDYLVLAGSVPNSLPDDLYSKILELLHGRGIKAVVDTTGNQLLNVLKYEPFLIKPNHHELGEIFSTEMNSAEKIIFYAKKLREMGAVNVLVSRGGDGAVLADGDGRVHNAAAVKGKLVNSVGCGDSMVAGFIAGYVKSESYDEALKLSIASSAATAFSKELAKADEIEKIYKAL
ncbi:MAG: 1-phosphofructokinase [Acutalibacteraceae bacterium]